MKDQIHHLSKKAELSTDLLKLKQFTEDDVRYSSMIH